MIIKPERFYRAYAGDKLALADATQEYNVATYLPKVDPAWINSYCYAPEQAWVMPNSDFTSESWRRGEYTFTADGYFKVYTRGGDAIIYFTTNPRAYEAPEWLTVEAARVAQRVAAYKQEGDLAFALVTDTHFVVNGTHHDTAHGIKLLAEKINLSGIIHLGDFTDGMLPAEETKAAYAEGMADFEAIGLPIYKVIGNHDTNYFKNNPEKFTADEVRAVYFNGGDIRYSVDLPGCGLFFWTPLTMMKPIGTAIPKHV